MYSEFAFVTVIKIWASRIVYPAFLLENIFES